MHMYISWKGNTRAGSFLPYLGIMYTGSFVQDVDDPNVVLYASGLQTSITFCPQALPNHQLAHHMRTKNRMFFFFFFFFVEAGVEGSCHGHPIIVCVCGHSPGNSFEFWSPHPVLFIF